MPSTTTSDNPKRRLILLGSTGSIGEQTLEVVANLNAQGSEDRSAQRFEIVGLAAGRNAPTLVAQARRYGVRELALADGEGAVEAPTDANLRRGADAAERLVREVEADLVVAAMVGSAGLPATLAAIDRGADIALANKETLVAAGELVVPAAQNAGAKLLPIDSEHSAIWQCLPAEAPPVRVDEEVLRVVLTASGGPFRESSRQQTYNARPEEALAHPTWSMGAKVTIDSASLTNKALEVIEAHWLFGLEPERIGVIVHPQSIAHSFVEFADGSVLAQLGAPDMRAPIQHALSHPRRAPGVAQRLDWNCLSRLDFERPDLDRFPALRLAYEAIEIGGAAGAVLNAANETAVEAFLDRRIPFGRIPELTERAMRDLIGTNRQPPLIDLDDVQRADAEARRYVATRLTGGAAASTARR